MTSSCRQLAVLAALTGAFAATGAEPAHAAVTCSFASGALTIQSGAELDSATIVRSGDNIVVRKGNNTPIDCGAQATVTNTHVIAHADSSGGETYFTIDLRGGPFTPGYVNEPGDSDEIDIQANLGDGADRLYVWGSPGDDFMRLGQTATGFGVNLNADAESAPGQSPNSDADIRGVEHAVVLAGTGNDRVLAGGGPEFSGPLGLRIEINAGPGDDRLAGGNGPDHFLDDTGSDEVRGGAGDDSMMEQGPNGENDVFDGGPGVDSLAWFEFEGALRVDLRLAGPQDTGAGGRDTLSALESVFTSESDDLVIGTDAANELDTAEGNDVILGLGGDDLISAGEGNDTASYAIPPFGVRRGVNVDLMRNGFDHDTGGAGVDRLDSVANVIGSPFADVLAGNQAANRLEVRDGTGDTVSCDMDQDVVVADVEGTDVVAGDCETVQFDIRPDTRIDSGPPSLTRDATPSFAFFASKDGATFECSLDGGAFRACPSGTPLAPVTDGAHALRVRARDLLGALDLSPAERAFSVDTIRPRIGRARLSRGGRLRYRLSEAARVKVVVRRPGKARTVLRHGSKGANGLKIRRAGARVTLVATDAAGNRSRPVRLRIG